MSTCLHDTFNLDACIQGNFEPLGNWWSPTAHPDSVLGVHEASIAESPALYADNYYTRVLLNRTDLEGPPLTLKDLKMALRLLRDRFSAIVIVENFATSALQLACTLGLDLERASPKLHTRVRPYAAHAALDNTLKLEKQFGPDVIRAFRARFVRRNRLDYIVYAFAKQWSQRRVAECAETRPSVALTLMQEDHRDAEALAADETMPHSVEKPPEEMTVDELFGCTGGTLQVADEGHYLLSCPRTIQQHQKSWWQSNRVEGQPKRKRGHRLPGAECWHSGFSWAVCCAPAYGEGGNPTCWDKEFTQARCCVTE